MIIDVRCSLGDCLIDVAIHGLSDGVTALFGPSGAGKTSIINMVAGLLAPHEGIISIAEHCLFHSEKRINIPPEKRHVGYVFQDARLFPHLSVESNLRYGRRVRTNTDRNIDFQQVCALLGITHLLARRPNTLSGGEKQRVALGRALLCSPRLLLMDEPLAALDDARKEELLPYIKRLNTEFHIPILYVTHAHDEVNLLADQIIYMANGKITHPPMAQPTTPLPNESR